MHRVLLTLFLFFICGKNSLACKLKTPFAKARIRKSCVALKSQANAVTFIFLSGIVLSQSLIVAYNFVNSTVPNMSFSEGMATPTGFAVGVPGEEEPELSVPAAAPVEAPPEESGDAAPIIEPADDGPTEEPIEVPAEEQDDEESQEPQTPAVTIPEDTETAIPADDEEEPLQESPASELDDGLAKSPSAPQDESANESQELPVPEPIPHIDNSTPERLPEPIAVPDENESSEIVVPVLPEPVNETQDLNETIDGVDNTTTSPELPDENNNSDDDIPDVTIPVFEEAMLEVSLAIPSGIKRGDTFTLVISLTNTGSAPANNIMVEPEMPDGASATESTVSIDSLAVGESSEVQFTIQLSYETLLGENEIKVRAIYE